MTKRRIPALVVVAMSVAALSGCGSKSAAPTTGGPAPTRAPTPTTAAPASNAGGGGYGY